MQALGECFPFQVVDIAVTSFFYYLYVGIRHQPCDFHVTYSNTTDNLHLSMFYTMTEAALLESTSSASKCHCLLMLYRSDVSREPGALRYSVTSFDDSSSSSWKMLCTWIP
jgi:hypothetical protein